MLARVIGLVSNYSVMRMHRRWLVLARDYKSARPKRSTMQNTKQCLGSLCFLWINLESYFEVLK